MDIILTNYFTSKKDPQRKKRWKSDDYKLIYPWLNSLSKLKLNGIIFYDLLSDEFINKHSNEYVKFIKYDIKTDWSLNDERFLCWYEFIEKNKNFNRIITTDLFDVSFNKNPFKLMKDKNRLYLGCNNKRLIRNNDYVVKKMRNIYNKVYHENMLSVNAGVISGYRENIILLFDSILKDFYKYNLSINMNMGVYNKIIYDLFGKSKLTIGFPFTSHFKKNETGGIYAIKHK